MSGVKPPPARLVVVDDERAQVDALRELLAGEGHEVHAFTAPQLALEHLRRFPPDVLLTDLQMPGMDGLELIEHGLRLDADLVPLLMTGHGSVETAVAAMKHGAIDFVRKPFRLRELQPVLARAIEIRQLRLQARDLSRRLAERSRQLEGANRELDAFAARVAHDLQGPVQNMVGFAREITELAQPADPLEVADLLERVIRSGARADAMIRDLLHFARLGNRPLATEAVALGPLLVRAQGLLAGGEQAARARWTVAALPTVRGDASLLLQVWVNLLSNALKYSAPVAAPCIDIDAEALAGGWWRISVSDNGVGFDAAQAHRLFAPFTRLHGLSEFPGTGMGLANVNRIVERHGGAVSAVGATGQGARISFTLPG